MKLAFVLPTSAPIYPDLTKVSKIVDHCEIFHDSWTSSKDSIPDRIVPVLGVLVANGVG